MTYVDDISELEFNNRPNKWADCYDDVVFNPSDIILQAMLPGLPPSSWGGYSITVNVYKPDGTYIEDASSYFNWFWGYASISSGTDNFYYANIQCNKWSPGMIANGCFVLNININGTIPTSGDVVFNKITQAYRLGSNCIYPSNITITQNGNALTATDCSVRNNNYCGRIYHKFNSYFDCQSDFTGEYHGFPTQMMGGNVTQPFGFKKTSYLEGRLYEMPRTIKRIYSLNCVFQRAETTNLYQFKPRYTVFPQFKKNEIELMLTANTLFLDDIEYRYAGDAPFTFADKCKTEYLLLLNLQDCDTYQIFNCTTNCIDTSQVLVLMIPSPTGKYYNQSGNLIATNITELETALKSLDQVTAVQDITYAAAILPYTPYKIYKITSSGYIPNYIYAGLANQASKVFMQPIDVNSIDLSNYGGGIITSKQCGLPVIGTIYSTEVFCLSPIIGDIWLTDPITYNLGFTSANGWTIDNSVTNGQLTEDRVTFEIVSSNPIYNYTEGKHTLINEEIGIISNMAFPDALITITPANNPTLQPDTIVTVDTVGVIRYSGVTTTEDGSGATVQLFGLNYNILNGI